MVVDNPSIGLCEDALFVFHISTHLPSCTLLPLLFCCVPTSAISPEPPRCVQTSRIFPRAYPLCVPTSRIFSRASPLVSRPRRFAGSPRNLDFWGAFPTEPPRLYTLHFTPYSTDRLGARVDRQSGCCGTRRTRPRCSN